MTRKTASRSHEPRRGFELRVLPDRDGTFRLGLYEHAASDSGAKSPRPAKPRSALSGWHLDLSQGTVRMALEDEGYRGADLRHSRRAPFVLSEDEGMRLDLLFRAIQGLNRRSRIEEILLGLRAMSREEVAYWHAKATREQGCRTVNGLRAFRVLLGGGGE